MMPWSHLVVGVADLNVALKLWVDEFGFEIVDQKSGSDEDFARLWGLEANDIAEQALIRCPGLSSGMVHFVQFNNPDEPVRQGAEVFDSCPKNLDIFVDDLPEKFEYFANKGWRFRSDNYSEVSTDSGITFREIHIPSHDDLNIVLLQIVGDERQYNQRGFAGIGPAISVVPDAAVEAEFYQETLNLDMTYENYLDGPEIEKMIGLPSGAGLDIKILGHPEIDCGRLELVAYKGVAGNNLYPKAKPKALGFLSMFFKAPSLGDVRQRLSASGTACREIPSGNTLFSQGPLLSFYAPSGFQVFVFEN